MCKIIIIIRAIIINTIIIFRVFTAQTPTITTATSTLLYYCYNAADNDPVADDQSGNRAKSHRDIYDRELDSSVFVSCSNKYSQ